MAISGAAAPFTGHPGDPGRRCQVASEPTPAASARVRRDDTLEPRALVRTPGFTAAITRDNGCPELSVCRRRQVHWIRSGPDWTPLSGLEPRQGGIITGEKISES